MAPALGLLIPVVIIVSILVALYLRAVFLEVRRTEERVRDPHTPTVVYEVPNGVDRSLFGAALASAGFTSASDPDGEHLWVECTPSQRERVRRIIESVHAQNYDGSTMRLGPVVFMDETAA